MAEATPEAAADGLPPDPPTGPPAPEPGTPAAMRAGLPAELRDNPMLDPYFSGDTPTGLEGLVKDHLGVQHLIGGDKISRPTAESSPEDWGRFYDDMGRPAEAKDYDLGDFTPPEGMPWDQDFQTRMLGKLHEAGLSNQHVNATVRAYAEDQADQLKMEDNRANETYNAVVRDMKAEWGQAYEANVELAKRVFKVAYGDDYQLMAAIKLPDGHDFGVHPMMLRAFHKLGTMMAEDSFIGKEAAASGLLTPEAAQQAIEEMEGDPDQAKILVTKSHGEHKALKAKQTALYKMANPQPGRVVPGT